MTEKVSVSEAVDRRISVRKFLPDPVPYETVYEILDIARRAPSGGNVQPWNVDVLTGDALQEFKAIVDAKLKSGDMETPQYDVYPKKLWEPHRSYRYKCGEDLYALIGVARADKLGRLAQMAENFKFFDAPVGLFFTFDRKFGPPQWSDVGMLMQTIMLLAVERGLDTCAQESWSQYPGYDQVLLRARRRDHGVRRHGHGLSRSRSSAQPIAHGPRRGRRFCALPGICRPAVVGRQTSSASVTTSTSAGPECAMASFSAASS